PYGSKRANNGALHTIKRFTGQSRGEDDLYWYRSRWYDSKLGRFIQPDTIVPNPGDPSDLNRYAYTRNNPLRYRDPSGHCIVGYSGGGVRMDEGPYGTSGLCPNTESAHHEGVAARDDYVESIELSTLSNPTEPFVSIQWNPVDMPTTVPPNAELGETLAYLSLIADYAQLGISVTGTVAEIGGLALGGPQGLGAVAAIYKGAVDPVEFYISGADTALVLGADYLGGNTFIESDYENVYLIVGQDSQANIVFVTASYFAPEAVTDTFVNLGTLYYDLGRLSNQQVPNWPGPAVIRLRRP
ncbi:MAG: RHS repeat-associated core domain-containing protein, partial [Gammaproteobacteria bacterium]|nr:RHS repeat-associated core domain-containing protein [Gammaproteobacteria bacterium]